jgi:hypothetical protein
VKRTLILAGLAFVLALAGSTAFVALRAPVPVRKAATETKPPAAGKGEGGASVPAPPAAPAPAAAAPDSAVRAPASAVATAATDGARGPEVTPVAPATPAPVRPAAAPAPTVITPADYASVAKILTGMKPVAAGEILKRLDDEQVEGILRSLGARQASTMLALLPPERGATLSRRLMRPSPAGAR